MAFIHGQSGNPAGSNGRNRAARAARAEIEKSIAVLADARDDANAPIALRVEAASRLLALGCPKFADVIMARGLPSAAQPASAV